MLVTREYSTLENLINAMKLAEQLELSWQATVQRTRSTPRPYQLMISLADDDPLANKKPA